MNKSDDILRQLGWQRMTGNPDPNVLWYVFTGRRLEMDEKEFLQQKIQELEAEIRELRAMLPKEKLPSRAMFPEAIAEKHGGLKKQGIAWEYNHTPFMSYKDLMDLSKIIRRCCFLRTKKEKCDTAKTLKEMTDEEYATYCEVLDKLLDVFQVYGCELNDNW